MISITDKPFPIAEGKDAERIIEDLRRSNEPPEKGTLAYRLVEHARKTRDNHRSATRSHLHNEY